MTCRLVVRSFGYGVMMVETVGPEPGSPEEMRTLVSTMFADVQEWVSAEGDPRRALLMVREGHAPTRYELSQLCPEDWEWMRDVVDRSGSGQFSDRLTMLEECRTRAVLLPEGRGPKS